jgi:hypothetical protein
LLFFYTCKPVLQTDNHKDAEQLFEYVIDDRPENFQYSLRHYYPITLLFVKGELKHRFVQEPWYDPVIKVTLPPKRNTRFVPPSLLK